MQPGWICVRQGKWFFVEPAYWRWDALASGLSIHDGALRGEGAPPPIMHTSSCMNARRVV